MLKIEIASTIELMDKKLSAVHQRPQDLRLAIVDADILPETRCLLEQYHSYRDWLIRFAIIGESHRVRVAYRGRFVMEEMLACVDIKPTNCLHHHPFDNLNAHEFNGPAYSVCVQIMPDTLFWEAEETEISYTFPEIHGGQAVTKIQWQQSENRLTWQTLHSYYDAGNLLCIYSQSNYNFQAEG